MLIVIGNEMGKEMVMAETEMVMARTQVRKTERGKQKWWLVTGAVPNTDRTAYSSSYLECDLQRIV